MSKTTADNMTQQEMLSAIGDIISASFDSQIEYFDKRFTEQNEYIDKRLTEQNDRFERRFTDIDGELRSMRQRLDDIDGKILGLTSDIGEIYDRIVALEAKIDLTITDQQQIAANFKKMIAWMREVSAKTGVPMPEL